jgi:hypothetical protein
MFLLSFIFVICADYISFVCICIDLGDPVIRRDWDPINWFNSAIFVYRSQARTWISNVICRGLFAWQNGPKWLCRNRESDCYLDLKNVFFYKIHTYSTKMFVLLKHFFYERCTNDFIINTKYMMYIPKYLFDTDNRSSLIYITRPIP